MENMELYNQFRVVPDEAKKQITAGRLKGMTDINPMWRIKVLTEAFGVCGFGWTVNILRTWIDEGANGEIVCNVEVELFVNQRENCVDHWSRGIRGIGGSKLVSKENAGLYTDDEAYKKAYTDAISVACKALGIGADVYFDKDRTKYTPRGEKDPAPDKEPVKSEKTQQRQNSTVSQVVSEEDIKRANVRLNLAIAGAKATGETVKNLAYGMFGKTSSADLTLGEKNRLSDKLEQMVKAG